MHHFHYKNDELYCEDVSIAKIAREVGTPIYVYSHATLTRHFQAFDGAFEDIKHITCFSMKSCSNLAIVRLFGLLGGGADIVSGGELFRALKAGISPEKIVYSGVGKRGEDLAYGLRSDILMFNAESGQEIQKLNIVAGKEGKKARLAIRVNPDVDPETHPYISTGLRENKFGIDIQEAVDHYEMASAMTNLKVTGVSCHIGSQLTQVSPFVDALKKVLELVDVLGGKGIHIHYLDIGGGLGITYEQEDPPHPREYAHAIKQLLDSTGLTLILEPGRVITGNAGILVTEVLYTKESGGKNFIIVDAAMNDLMRPALYSSYHAIQPIVRSGSGYKIRADVVGPICESGDFFARDREVDPFKQGDLMAIMSAGAYGFSMSSNYNSRPRPPEVMVRDDEFHIIRARETYEDLVRGEVIPDFLQD